MPANTYSFLNACCLLWLYSAEFWQVAVGFVTISAESVTICSIGQIEAYTLNKMMMQYRFTCCEKRMMTRKIEVALSLSLTFSILVATYLIRQMLMHSADKDAQAVHHYLASMNQATLYFYFWAGLLVVFLLIHVLVGWWLGIRPKQSKPF